MRVWVRCNRDRAVRRLTVRDRTRSGRSLWQEQVLLVDHQARSIGAVTTTFHVETGTFDRDGQLAFRRPSCRRVEDAELPRSLASMMVLAARRWGRMITRLSSVYAVAPNCMAEYLWPSTARRPLEPKNFPLPHPRASAGPDRHSPRTRLRRQNSRLRPGRSASLALVARAPALFRLPGHYGKAIATTSKTEKLKHAHVEVRSDPLHPIWSQRP